jgi:hypothetical protein
MGNLDADDRTRRHSILTFWLSRFGCYRDCHGCGAVPLGYGSFVLTEKPMIRFGRHF